ncbi:MULTISPECIES: hypothetical protein [Microbacterium]|uniref:hypothetical protein n=1 Tax=Microbacterium TaxID=33882 RepID=UPI002784C5DC|nr:MULTISPECIES: hypothetical protein [Microbacterium]MDQ1084578.1 hypothetical protein [Microbacterium sp. SORGH_AS_0344]MDQ1170144.1 hypothetical protein [Microbacterium proteolyticum]
MTETPDATRGDAPRAVPVPSTGSGTSAPPQEAELVDASGTSGQPVRQPVVRVRGSRRARLLPAPGTTAEPAPADDRERGAGTKPAASGPNDDRMLRDVPPHY